MTFNLIFKERFDSTFSKIKDSIAREQIWKKIQQLKERAPIGKKLTGHPFWSIHVGRFRVIYLLHAHSNEIELIDILERKHDYRELR